MAARIVDNPREPDLADIPIGYYRGSADQFLLALDGAGLEGAILVIDTGDPETLSPFVEERTAHRPELLAKNRKAREVKFKFLGIHVMAGHYLYLPIEGSNLRDLGARPEILLSLTVEDEHGYGLVDAHDVGDSEICVNDRTPDSVTRALREALARDLTPSP